MKRTDKPFIFIIGDNNKVNFCSGRKKILPLVIALAVSIAITITVLVISLRCPELLADFIRWIIRTAITIN